MKSWRKDSPSSPTGAWSESVWCAMQFCRTVLDLAELCRHLAELSKETRRQVGVLLQAQIPKIKVVDHQKVAAWIVSGAMSWKWLATARMIWPVTCWAA